MSIHKSLKLKGALRRARNVYSRWERYEMLLQEGRIDEGRSVFSLPKTRGDVIIKKKKK